MSIRRRLGLVDELGSTTFRGDTVVVIGGAAFLLVVAAAVVFPLLNHSAHVSCLRLHEVTGLDTRYVRSGVQGECYVNEGGRWVPESRWRVEDGAP